MFNPARADNHEPSLYLRFLLSVAIVLSARLVSGAENPALAGDRPTSIESSRALGKQRSARARTKLFSRARARPSALSWSIASRRKPSFAGWPSSPGKWRSRRKWALGFHQCRYSYYPDAKVREIADVIQVRVITDNGVLEGSGAEAQEIRL